MGSKLKRTEAEMPVNGDGSHSHSAGKKKKKIKSSAPSAEPYDQVAVDGDQVKRKEVEVEVAVDADEAKKKKKKKKKKSKEAKNREADGIHTEDINPAETENGIENGGKKEKKRNRSKGGNGDVSVSGHGSEDVKYRALESFEAAGLTHHVLQCCKNFEKPSPIQAQAWPYLLDDRDFIGIAATGSGSSKAESLWLASTPSKRWGEIFFMAYTPFWLILCLGIVVPYRLYERFTELDYLVLGLVSALPSFMLPFVLVGKGDKSKHWFECYWAKASLWIIIFSYVGNYFWTHYFFAVLGASYTFPSWRMNNVPHTTFLLTHACFLFYHVASNITLRRVRHAISDLPSHVQWAIQAIWILTLSYIIALLETFAIANFPYYDFVDRAAMYKVGSLFYAIYFIVSFPMFMRLDEKPNDPWSLSRTAIDALAAAMIVTIILDLWRLFLGPIVEIPTSIPYKECLSYGLPWMS